MQLFAQVNIILIVLSRGIFEKLQPKDMLTAEEQVPIKCQNQRNSSMFCRIKFTIQETNWVVL